jgi:DNA-binding NarL/FixJ family response regulator
MSAIRVLIADDQPLVLAGLSLLLSSEPDVEVIASVSDGAAALAAAEELRPDVAVVDARMPGMDGIEVSRALCAGADGPSVRVLVISTYRLPATIYAALRTGASGFLLKDAAPSHLGLAVRAVAAGHGWLDPQITVDLIGEFAARPEPAALPPAELEVLTAREQEILALVAQGMSNQELARRLFITQATVKTHLARVLMKLNLHNRAEAVATAYQSGLVTVSRSHRPPAGTAT